MLPEQLERWKRTLVVECDPIRSWFADHLRRVEGESFVFNELRASLRQARLKYRDHAELLEKLQAELPDVRPERYGLNRFELRFSGVMLEG